MNPKALGKIQLTQKKFFWGLIGIAAVLFFYTYVLVPIGAAKKKADEEIALKRRILAKYTEVLMSRKSVEASLERTLKNHEELQKRLLPGETPQLGAAHLQDIVKRLSEKHKINLRSFRTLEAKEAGIFRKISLQIDFNPISSMRNLTELIFDLENQDKELMISELDLLISNPRMPSYIQGNLVVSGLMVGPRGKEKGKEREK
jgi:hypothetical protein